MTESIAPSEIASSPELNAKLFAKMAGVMGRLERLEKRGENKHFNYKYVTDADVLEAVRTAMAAEGLAFFVDMGEVQQGNNRTLIPFTLTFADGESGATRTINWVGEAIDRQDKGISKAATAAIKYALLKTFLISTGDQRDDPDQGIGGSSGTEEQPEEPAMHWIDKASEKGPVSDRFNAFVQKQGLTFEAALQKLGVDAIHKYTGSMEDAMETLTKSNPAPKAQPHVWPQALLLAIVEAGYAKNTYNAEGMLKLSKELTPESQPQAIMGWCEQYRALRDDNIGSGIAGEETDMWLKDQEDGTETPIIETEDIPF